jgi:hypothetical protein
LSIPNRKSTSISSPIRDTKPNSSHQTLNANEETTLRGLGYFSDIDRDNSEELATSEAGDEPACDHHADMNGTGLQSGSEDSKKGSKGDGILATEAIGKIANCWGSNGLTGVVA